MAKKIKANLSIQCCGVNYSPRDPENYWRFTCLQNDYKDNPFYAYPDTCFGVKLQKVYKTLTYELACKQGCTKVKVLKFDKTGVLLDTELINKRDKVLEHLNKIRETAKEITLRCPIKSVPTAKRIDYIYGKRESIDKTIPTSLDGLFHRKAIKCPITQCIDEKYKRKDLKDIPA